MIPTVYTELSLAEYMVTVTRNVSAALGWVEDDFAEAVNDVLIAYGELFIDDATNIPKLRAIARLIAWRAVVDGTAADTDFAADGANYKSSQLHDHAVKALERAVGDAAPYLDTAQGYAIGVGTLVFADGYGVVDASN